MTPRQVGLLGLLAAIWGGSYLLIKYCLEGFSPPFIVFGRTLIGALVLFAAVRLQGGATWAALARTPAAGPGPPWAWGRSRSRRLSSSSRSASSTCPRA